MKKQHSRSRDTVPLSTSFKKQKINLGIDRTLYMQYKLVFVSEKYTIKSNSFKTGKHYY